MPWFLIPQKPHFLKLSPNSWEKEWRSTSFSFKDKIENGKNYKTHDEQSPLLNPNKSSSTKPRRITVEPIVIIYHMAILSLQPLLQQYVYKTLSQGYNITRSTDKYEASNYT